VSCVLEVKLLGSCDTGFWVGEVATVPFTGCKAAGTLRSVTRGVEWLRYSAWYGKRAMPLPRSLARLKREIPETSSRLGCEQDHRKEVQAAQQEATR
jgi:hypothetical protein